MATNIRTVEEKERVLAKLFDIERKIREEYSHEYDLKKLCRFLDAIIDCDKGITIEDELFTTIDCDKTIEEMLNKYKKAHRHDFINPAINDENFPIKEKGLVKADLIFKHFDCVVNYKNLIYELSRRDLQPGTLQDFFAYIEKNSNVIREFQIVIPGVVLKKDGKLYTLVTGRGCFDLMFHPLDIDFNHVCRFLARHK